MPNVTYLAHHGIKGQKWGVRRFRNNDGSLTAAGKQRYNDGETSEQRGFNKKKAAKVALGVAAAAGIGYALANPKSRQIINDYRKKSLSSIAKVAFDDNTKEFLARNGKKLVGTVTEKSKTVGTFAAKKVGERFKNLGNTMADAAIDAALASAGAMALSKVTEAFKSNDGDSAYKQQVNQILEKSATAGINQITGATANGNKAKNNSSAQGTANTNAMITKAVNTVGAPSKKGVDKQSKAYQDLFKDKNGNSRDDDTRAVIKELAKAGYDIDQIREGLDLRHGDTMETSSLVHHGIIGMKWGVRRYRNKDG